MIKPNNEPSKDWMAEMIENSFIASQEGSVNSRILFFLEAINSLSAASLCDRLTYLSILSDDPILLVVGGPGGDAGLMLAITQIIKAIRSPVHTLGIGHIASGCCFMLMAGDLGHRYIHKSSTMMLHNPQLGLDSDALPSVQEYLKGAQLQEIEALKLLLPKNLKPKAYQQWLKDRHDYVLLDAKTAKEVGFADKVITKFSFSKYQAKEQKN